MPELTTGRIVRYHFGKDSEAPAMITGILRTETGRYLEAGSCHLTVFGVGHETHVTANYGTGPGEWSWPEYDQPEPIDEVE